MNIKELYKIYKRNPIICTDSRKIIEKGIFFALKGKNFDGNKFAQSAISQGCSYAIVDDKQFINNKNNRIILVQDVLETLQLLAIHDAFFPFPDCVELANEAGIKAVIQPGGSIKDELSINYCNQHNMSMVMTGTRHFKH